MAANIIPSSTPASEARGMILSTSEVRALLSEVANRHPDTALAMDVANALIVQLESFRHEALLPLSFGHLDNVERYLKKPTQIDVDKLRSRHSYSHPV